jgi:hypothetical protein
MHQNINNNIAKLVKDNLPGFSGHAALYKVAPPIKVRSWDDTKPEQSYRFVIVSTANVMGRYETFMFPATKEGKVASWTEMDGSQVDTTSHSKVISNAGYTLVG